MAMELNAMGIPHLPQSKEELNQIFRLAENRPNAYAILLTVLKNLKRLNTLHTVRPILD